MADEATRAKYREYRRKAYDKNYRSERVDIGTRGKRTCAWCEVAKCESQMCPTRLDGKDVCKKCLNILRRGQVPKSALDAADVVASTPSE